eukprot:742081_1
MVFTCLRKLTSLQFTAEIIMSTDLTGCKIHIEQQLPSHIYIDRYYELSIYLKCAGVPKFLNQENEIEAITSIISADSKQMMNSPLFIVDNPSSFKRSGDTSTKFKITSLSTQFERYCVQCSISNSPVSTWVSDPFTVVQYKFGMTKQLQLIDGDKWYKDEGGKTNFLSFEMGLHQNHNNLDQFIVLQRDIAFKLQLVYFDDKSLVLNQNILRIVSDQQYILSEEDKGKVEIQFKIEQVSSHHQRRRFSLKVIPINDKTIGPCCTKPILVLSKRNRPKKTPHTMSAQKRKEVATKKKIKKRKRDDEEFKAMKVKQEPVPKKRKLNKIQIYDAMHQEDDDETCSSSSASTVVLDQVLKEASADHEVNQLILSECALKSGQYPSLKEYQRDPDQYFDYAQPMKHNLVQCLKLCCDTFSVLSARPQYHPLFGFGEENTAHLIYYCSFCKRFAQNAPHLIDHYERCRILEVIKLLKGEESQAMEPSVIPIDKGGSHSASAHAIPIDKGTQYKFDALSRQLAKKEKKTNININSNLDTNAMINAMLQTMPALSRNSNSNNTRSNTIPTNNFAAALNEILHNATASNANGGENSNNGNTNQNNNTTSDFVNLNLPNPFSQLLLDHNK